MIFTTQGSYGLKDSRREARRDKQKKFFGFFLKVAFWLAVMMVAYWFGGERYVLENKRLLKAIHEEQTRHPEMRAELEALKLETLKLKTEKNTLAAKFSHEVPQGVSKPLFDMVQGRIEAGVTPERLTYVLENVQNEGRCDAAPVVKKLLVETKLQKKGEILSFFGDQLRLKALGQTTKNASGLVEAWFDPLESITFTLENGPNKQSKTVTSKLPFHQSRVVDSKEYRLTITNGPRGYVQVSALQCMFP